MSIRHIATHHWAVVLTGLLFSVLMVDSAEAQAVDGQVWTLSNPIEDHDFGYSLDLDGDVAVVGAPNDGDPLEGRFKTGAAYVFRYDGTEWGEEARLIAPQGQPLDALGISVAVSGDFAFVGTSNENSIANNAGAVYVFQHDGGTWSMVQKLTASDGAANDAFGTRVAIEGDLAAVSATGHAENGVRSGTVYIFRYDGTNWVEADKLTPSDATAEHRFGSAVDVQDGRVLVGAFGVQTWNGAAYLYTHDGSAWSETAIFTVDDGHNLAQFGISVSLDGDRALIGANMNNELGAGAGAAYLFRDNGTEWVEEAKLTASDGAGFYLFGAAVALSGTRALVGAENWAPVVDDVLGDAPGKAYLFTYDQEEDEWVETAGFTPNDGEAGDHFGKAVAMQGEVILIGAPDRDTDVAGAGEVYSYGDPNAVPAESVGRPAAFRLGAVYPNPFRDTARLRLTLDRAEHARVRLVDLLGRERRVLHDGPLPAGAVRVLEIDARDLAAGVYLVRVETPTFAETRRIVLRR